MKISSTRGRVVRLSVAAVLFAGVASIGLGSAARADVLPADNCAHKVPTGTLPNGTPVPSIPGIYSPEDTCVEKLQRTLVFVGQSILNNGVNFSGVGDPTMTNLAGKTGGGNFDFDGICVMVDWQAGTRTSTPSVSKVLPCVFGSTGGHFEGPTSTGNFVGQTLDGKTGNNLNPAIPATPVNPNTASGLKWDPNNQASCFNSSGGGTSTFTSYGSSGAPEVWTSNFSWTNSLNNFVGDISSATAGSGKFNAKIRTDADPAADKNKMGDRTSNFAYAIDVDRTDAGCLDKTLHSLNNAYDNVSASRLGLQALVVSGTATWDIRAPGLG